ncbi:MAG: alkaline phosphatase D family protein [Verrucomicrobiales bacterium]
MKVRFFIFIGFASSLLAQSPQADLAKSRPQGDEQSLEVDRPIRLLAFGSCLKQTRPAPALEAIAELAPEVFVWMGDNVYADTEDMKVLREKYAEVRALSSYQEIDQRAAVVGTWDDHDYGANDAGKEYPKKKESQQVFLDFLDEAEESPRRAQEGVYGRYDFGPDGQQVRVILLDTRYHRDPVGSDGTMLGEAQWAWLEASLRQSVAQVNILVSSIQFLPTEHRFEKWANFPRERQRLLDLLRQDGMPPVLILSGDRHLAEISRDEKSLDYPLYEITSSSLNQPLGGSEEEPNEARLGVNFRPPNFGTLSFDWGRESPVITAAIWEAEGYPQRAVSFQLPLGKAQLLRRKGSR